MSSDFIEFLEREKQRLFEEQRARFGAPILRLEEGKVYALSLDINKEWRKVTTRFGERIVIPVTYENSEYVLMVNPSGSLYRSIVEQLYSKLKNVDLADVTGVNLVIKRQSGKYSVIVDVELSTGKHKSKK